MKNLPGHNCDFKKQTAIKQMAFTHLAYTAGLQVDEHFQDNSLILTDDIEQIQANRRVIWIKQGNTSMPKGVSAWVDLSISPTQLKEIVEKVERGESLAETEKNDETLLSEREREILGLLAQGLRDRDVANRLIISESTVKFHLNNVLTKLKARTRYQALYYAIAQGLI
jgi:DNA-binding NarL/FixJ family response regulator